MVRRQIDFDEETHESLETFVEQSEEVHRASLLAQVERSERGFRAGRFTRWEEVKRRNRL